MLPFKGFSRFCNQIMMWYQGVFMKTKKSILTLLFLAAGVSLSGLTFAEGAYPAANFEPYIVYQAPEIAGDTAAWTENDSSEKTSEGSVSVVEGKDPYPASHFQPVIVYQAEEVIAAQETQPEAESVPVAAATADKSSPSKVIPVAASVMEESGVPPTMMIAILALLGWVVLQFRSGGTTVVEEELATEEDPAKDIIDEIKSLAASIGAEVEITRDGRE
jgi:hypothetical protein